MKSMVKGSGLLTAVSVGEMFMRLVRTKCIAIILGPAGTGFLAQTVILFEGMRTLGDLGIRQAVVKQVAERRDQSKSLGGYLSVVKTALVLVTLTSVTIAAGIVAFSPQLSQLLYGTAEHYLFIAAVGIMLPIATIQTVIASVIKGNMDYVAYARCSLFSYGLVVLATPALIYGFKLWGGVVVVGLFFLVPLASYLVLNLKKKYMDLSGAFDWRMLKEQFVYGGFSLYQDGWTHVLKLVVATWVIRQLGLDSMGLYQVVITFTTVYMAVPIQTMSGYVFPLIAGSEHKNDINVAVNEALRFLMFTIVPIIVLIMILPDLLIVLLYSSEFLPAVPILRTQLFSSLFLLMTYPFTATLIAKGKFKGLLWVVTLTPILLVVLGVSMFEKMGLMALALAFSVTGLFTFLSQFYLARHHFGIRILPKNKPLIQMSFLWIGLAYAGTFYSDDVWMRSALLFFGVAWFAVSSKDHEREFIASRISMLLRRLDVGKN